jgi:MerR family mercuric resistance operon transcriptional regulator
MPITKPRSASYSTGELARLATVHHENIRYFERIGLIPPARRGANGRRQFGEEHRRRLVFIRRARDLGFSQDEVRALIALADGVPSRCLEVKALADANLRAIRHRIEGLKRMERLLAEVSAKCGNGRRPVCPVIEALLDEDIRT